MEVIVLGMHQSGTSLVAGLIKRMGLYFGPSELGQDNFEPPEVRRLHDSLLHSCGTDGYKIDAAAAALLAASPFDLFQPDARQIIDQMNAHRPWFMTEPRLCFLLPFWRQFLEKPVCIHVVRNPLEIALSLKERHGFTIQYGLALWELYSVAALQNTRDLPRITVHYADLIHDPLGSSRRLRQQLEIAGAPGLTNPSDTEIRDFVDATSYRERVEECPLGEYLNQKQSDLYEALQTGDSNLASHFAEISQGAAEALSIQKNIWDTSQKKLQPPAEVHKSSHKSWKTHWKLIRLQEAAKNNLDDSLALLHAFQQEHLKTLNSLPWILGNLLYLRLWILSRKKRLHRLRELEGQIDQQRHKNLQSSTISMSESARKRRSGEKKPRPVAVVIPIFNAYEEVVACIDSLLLHTTHPHEILLIDDHSTDARIWPRLRKYAKTHDHIRAIRNQKNLGYTRTVNLGCEFTRPCDLVLLNSDTLVTPFWLEKLTATAYSRTDVATVTAVSNAAGNFSIPVNKIDNPIPDGLSPAEFAWWVEKLSKRRRPLIPCGNGFCLFVRRTALDKVGRFDEVSFPRGYGEENDFCMRARHLGLQSLVDDATFIYHKRTASFGEEKGPLLEASKLKLQELHPEYKELRKQWLKNDPVDELRQSLQKAPWLAPFRQSPTKPPLLYVIHSGGGGTRFTSEDLIRGMMAHYEVLLLETSECHWTLFKASGHKLTPLRRYHFAETWQYYQPVNRERLDVLDEILHDMNIGIIHFRHLVGNGPDALLLAKQKGLRVILSLHDFYTVCPTTTLLDERLQYCGGHCTPGTGLCELRGRWFDHNGPLLKHDYVHVHRKLMSDALSSACDALITTSTFSRNLIAEHFPAIASRLHAIEHGRDLHREDLAVTPRTGNPARVVCLGNMNASKGIHLIREIMTLDQMHGRRFEFHFLGSLPKELVDLPQMGGIVHGKYKREHLSEHLREIGPSFSIVSSIWPETYCHTLTESWAVGLPVFASKIGTLQERVEQHGGGWLLDYHNAQSWYQEMVAVLDNPADFENKREEIRRMPTKTVAEMTAEYLHIYHSLGADAVRTAPILA